MKIQTFDRNLIRTYMEDSSVLEKGIAYVQHVNPGTSRAVAEETAIRMAVERCERRWYNDTTGYLSSEYVVFQELVSDVENKRFFYIKGMKDPEEAKREAEEKAAEQRRRREKQDQRMAELRKHCQENNLNFLDEYDKLMKKLKMREKISTALSIIFFLIGAVALFIAVFIAENFGIWLLITGLCVGGIAGAYSLDPKLPE